MYEDVKNYLTIKRQEIHDSRKKLAGTQPSPWAFIPSEPRENFNEVYPRILLGNYFIAKNKEELKRKNVTHVVNCAQGTKSNQINTDEGYFSDTDIKFLGLEALDVERFPMNKFFQPAADFIVEALANKGVVYVHCMSGMSRSGAIVLSYLMIKRGMSVMDAVKLVRDKREIFPNDGFLKQLCELDQQLQQQR
ncbi:dual specificity protein phosphatase 3-like [Crassostrea angulata]|uniref:dual specificity protein phosphatase 3-like n=1 Tax=Magallana angulata TaxID=2784310 RepID=UPI0022B19640|nr:dual specificity protein phosphatase 3-like [Crassostrea angulata]